MNTKQRLLQYLAAQNISVYTFSKALGFSSSNFCGAALKSELSGAQLSKILTYYDDLNADWLICGRGNMLKNECVGVAANTQTFQQLVDIIDRLSAENTALRLEAERRHN